MKSLTQIHRFEGPRHIELVGPDFDQTLTKFCSDQTVAVTPVTATERHLAYAVLSRSEASHDSLYAIGLKSLKPLLVDYRPTVFL